MLPKRSADGTSVCSVQVGKPSFPDAYNYLNLILKSYGINLYL